MHAQTVVGVGASAGGLEALEKLLDGVRPDGRSAFVIVTHLSPDFKSLLDELLKRHTEMPVRVVEDGMSINADVIYVIPPNTEMIAIQNTLHLSDRDRGASLPLPINTFLSSLANEYGPNGIAVILSGSGSDGAKGARDVQDAGGMVIVQDPDSARFESMPKATLDRCAGAKISKAEKIGAIIAEHTAGGDIETSLESEELTLDLRAQALNEILQRIYGASNVDFSLYKMTTVYRRVRRRMVSRGHDTLNEYLQELEQNAEELATLADSLLITVSEFFRDTEAFDFLAKEVVPELVANSRPSQPIRIWIPACSSGQEAYSIAMLLYMEGRRTGARLEPQIYATDLREASVQRASAGTYNLHELSGLSEEMLRVCFEKISQDEYRIIQPIRRWIVFAQHNILRDPPFTRLNLVSCRNVLIYFEPEAQRKVLSLLNFGLRDRGILFLGRSESLGELEGDFKPLNASWRVFCKTGASSAVHLTLGDRLGQMERNGDSKPSYGVASLPMVSGKQRLGPAYAALIDSFIPQGALITHNREVLHLFGDADDLLRAPKGMMDADILKMAPPPLRVPIAAALDRARSERREIVFPRLKIPFAERPIEVLLRVVPLYAAASSDVRYFFVGLEQEQVLELTPLPSSIAAPPQVLDASMLESERIGALGLAQK